MRTKNNIGVLFEYTEMSKGDISGGLIEYRIREG
jgi:hypothetical protein